MKLYGTTPVGTARRTGSWKESGKNLYHGTKHGDSTDAAFPVVGKGDASSFSDRMRSYLQSGGQNVGSAAKTEFQTYLELLSGGNDRIRQMLGGQSRPSSSVSSGASAPAEESFDAAYARLRITAFPGREG